METIELSTEDQELFRQMTDDISKAEKHMVAVNEETKPARERYATNCSYCQKLKSDLEKALDLRYPETKGKNRELDAVNGTLTVRDIEEV